MQPAPTTTVIAIICCSALANAESHGQFAKWAKIEFAFTGPDMRGRGEPNPFAVRLHVDFASPSERQYHVPGFYDGDGKGGLDGNVWKVRFSADELGQWKFRTSSDNKMLDGNSGSEGYSSLSPDAQLG